MVMMTAFFVLNNTMKKKKKNLPIDEHRYTRSLAARAYFFASYYVWRVCRKDIDSFAIG